MSEEKKECSYLLPVAIMAHNEETVIKKTLENVLSQNAPIGYSIKTVVVANGCTDRTEEVVKGQTCETFRRTVALRVVRQQPHVVSLQQLSYRVLCGIPLPALERLPSLVVR